MQKLTKELELLNRAKEEPVGLELQKPTAQQVEAAVAGLSDAECFEKLKETLERVRSEAQKHLGRMYEMEDAAESLRHWAEMYEQEKFLRQQALDIWTGRRIEIEAHEEDGSAREAIRWLSQQGLNPQLSQFPTNRTEECAAGKLPYRHSGKHSGKGLMYQAKGSGKSSSSKSSSSGKSSGSGKPSGKGSVELREWQNADSAWS